MSAGAGAGAGGRLPIRAWLAVALLLAAAAGATAGVAWARRGERHPTYLEQLTEALDLRPEQTAAIESLLGEEDRDLDLWLEQSLAGLRDQVAERRERTEQSLLAVLDAEQRERYDRLSQPAR